MVFWSAIVCSILVSLILAYAEMSSDGTSSLCVIYFLMPTSSLSIVDLVNVNPEFGTCRGIPSETIIP